MNREEFQAKKLNPIDLILPHDNNLYKQKVCAYMRLQCELLNEILMKLEEKCLTTKRD